MRKEKQFGEKKKFLFFTTSKIHKNVGLYQKSSLAKVPTTTPKHYCFLLYSPIDNSNHLIVLNILTMVSLFVLLIMSLHFNLSTYLLLCQIALQCVKYSLHSKFSICHIANKCFLVMCASSIGITTPSLKLIGN